MSTSVETPPVLTRMDAVPGTTFTEEQLATGPYAEEIERYRTLYNETRSELRYARGQEERHLIGEQLDQYLIAVEVLREATIIALEAKGEPAFVQFGTHESSEWSTRIPPRLKQHESERQMIYAQQYRYITNDPVEIAWLRRMVREGGIPGLHEMKHGLMAIHGPEGLFAGWMPGDVHDRMVRAGGAREW